MPSYDAVAVFASVAGAGSFTKAARTLGTPISTLSRKVAELEDDLGVKLLDRSRRQIRLTEAGAQYLEMCGPGLDMLAFATRTLRERRQDMSGTLRVSLPPNLAELLFLDPIDAFLRRYPQANVRISVSERVLDFVDDTIDLSFRVARPELPDLVIRSLMTHRHRLVAAPVYLSRQPAPATPDDLDGHNRLGFGFHGRDRIEWRISRAGEDRQLAFVPDLAINDYAALKAAALRGLGICELPGIMCGNELESGRLVEVLPQWSFPETTLYAVHTGEKGLSRLARQFLDTVTEYIGRPGSPGFGAAG